MQPSGKPSSQPSGQPTGHPTSSAPSGAPSGQPSSQPTSPTGQPSSKPSSQPSGAPSSAPTSVPSKALMIEAKFDFKQEFTSTLSAIEMNDNAPAKAAFILQIAFSLGVRQNKIIIRRITDQNSRRRLQGGNALVIDYEVFVEVNDADEETVAAVYGLVAADLEDDSFATSMNVVMQEVLGVSAIVSTPPVVPVFDILSIEIIEVHTPQPSFAPTGSPTESPTESPADATSEEETKIPIEAIIAASAVVVALLCINFVCMFMGKKTEPIKVQPIFPPVDETKLVATVPGAPAAPGTTGPAPPAPNTTQRSAKVHHHHSHKAKTDGEDPIAHIMNGGGAEEIAPAAVVGQRRSALVLEAAKESESESEEEFGDLSSDDSSSSEEEAPPAKPVNEEEGLKEEDFGDLSSDDSSSSEEEAPPAKPVNEEEGLKEEDFGDLSSDDSDSSDDERKPTGLVARVQLKIAPAAGKKQAADDVVAPKVASESAEKEEDEDFGDLSSDDSDESDDSHAAVLAAVVARHIGGKVKPKHTPKSYVSVDAPEDGPKVVPTAVAPVAAAMTPTVVHKPAVKIEFGDVSDSDGDDGDDEDDEDEDLYELSD